MDPISVARAAAWLNAVRRVQAQSHRSFVEQVPRAEPARPDRKLTDLLESALIDAGGRPQQVAAACRGISSTGWYETTIAADGSHRQAGSAPNLPLTGRS